MEKQPRAYVDQQNLRDLFSELTDAELGALVREYIAESDHQGWDGFRNDQKSGFNAVMVDMFLYYESCRDGGSLPLHGRAVTYGAYYDGPDQKRVAGSTILV